MNRNNPCNTMSNPEVNQPINGGIYAPDDHHPSMSRDRILHMQGYIAKDVKRSLSASTLTGSPLDDIPGFAGAVIATYDDTEVEGKLKDFAGTANMTLAGTVSPVPQEFLGFKKSKRIIFTPSANGTLRLLLKNSTGTDSGNTIHAPRTDNEHFHFTLSRDSSTPFASIPFYVQEFGDDTEVIIFSDAGDIILFYSHDDWTNRTLIVPTQEIDEIDLIASYDMVDSYDDSGTLKLYDRKTGTYNATVTDATVGGETGTTLTGDGTKVDRALGESIVMPTADDIIFHRKEVEGEYPLVTMPDIPDEPTFSGSTIVVDAGGTGDYTSIQEAIDAASPGDIVYIKNGTYNIDDAFSILLTELKIVGESREGVVIDMNSGFIELHDTVLKNVTVTGDTYVGAILCSGNAFVVDSKLIGTGVAYNAVRLSGQYDVVFDGVIFEHSNGIGTRTFTGNVCIKDCDFSATTWAYNDRYYLADSGNIYFIGDNGDVNINLNYDGASSKFYSQELQSTTITAGSSNEFFFDEITATTITLSDTATLTANVLIGDTVTVDATATLDADILITPSETTVNHGTYYHIGLLSASLTDAKEEAVIGDFLTVPEEPDASTDTFLFRATDFNGIDQYGKATPTYGAEGTIAIRWSALDPDSATKQTILSLYADADNYTSLSIQSGDLVLEEVEAGITTETLTLTPPNDDVQMSFITWSATSLTLHNAARGTSLATATGTGGMTSGSVYIAQLGNDTQWAEMILRRLSIYDRILTDEEMRILVEHNLNRTFTYAPNTSLALLNSSAMPSYTTDDNYKVAQVYDGTTRLTSINDERIPLTADVVNLHALFKPTVGDDQEVFSKTDGTTNILTITYNATAKTLTASAEDGAGNKTATVSALEQRWICCHAKLKDDSLELFASDGLTSGIATVALSARQKDADLPVTIGDGLNGRIAELNIWEGEDDWMSDDVIINNIHQEVGWQ